MRTGKKKKIDPLERTAWQDGKRESIEGCFIFTRDEWIVLSSALDRFVTGRAIPVKARAKFIASRLFKQIRDYVLTPGD